MALLFLSRMKGEKNMRKILFKGVKIVEGDVVRLDCGIHGTYEITMLDLRNRFRPIKEEYIREIEVIGNVYGNRKTMEVK